jgi:chromosome segregation ATPase
MKEEFNKYTENLRNENQTEILEIKSSLNQIKNTVESHSSRLEQVENRISGLEEKIDIKEKTEFLDKMLKSCERNMQELRFHQETKLANHGYQRRRRVASQ